MSNKLIKFDNSLGKRALMRAGQHYAQEMQKWMMVAMITHSHFAKVLRGGATHEEIETWKKEIEEGTDTVSKTLNSMK